MPNDSKGLKLNTKYQGYLKLPCLHDDEALKKLEKHIQCKETYSDIIAGTQYQG